MNEESKYQSQAQEGVIDLRDLSQFLIKKWKTVMVGSALIGIVSIIYSLSLTNEYTATIFLTETKKDKETSLSSASTEIGLGLSLPGGFGGGNGLTQEMNSVIIMMKSWDFIDDFIRENQLEAPLLAGEGWDPVSKKLLFNENKYDSQNEVWTDNNFDVEDPSIRWELYKEFIDEMDIIGDKNTSVHSLSITFYDPEMALDWVNKFYKLANQKLREKKLITLDDNIKGLRKQISENSSTILREKLYEILSRQINSKAVIEASPNYVIEPLGDPLVPFERSFPRRTLVVLGLTIVGSLFLIMGLMIYRFITVQRQN